MSSSRVPAAIDALVAALEAALDPATVFDGPELTGDTPAVAVCVGYDGDPGGDMSAVENWSQDWAGLGAQRKAEEFDVVGCVIASSGDTSVKTRRDAVFATFATVETALRQAANVGLGLPQYTEAQFVSGGFFQEQGPSGLQARIPFFVHVKTRI